MRLQGTIVGESLIDERMINDFQVVGCKVTTEEDSRARWHLYSVTVGEEQIDKLAHNLKPEKWYAHFWHGDMMMVVFPGKTFKLVISNKATWIEAIAYGVKLGIPEEQLDFITK